MNKKHLGDCTDFPSVILEVLSRIEDNPPGFAPAKTSATGSR